MLKVFNDYNLNEQRYADDLLSVPGVFSTCYYLTDNLYKKYPVIINYFIIH